MNEPNRPLYLRQRELLDTFLSHGAITRAQYETSLRDLRKKMGVTEEPQEAEPSALELEDAVGGLSLSDLPGGSSGSSKNVMPGAYTLTRRCPACGAYVLCRRLESGSYECTQHHIFS